MNKFIKKYKTIKEALESTLKHDKEYRFLVHKFPVGKRVKKHYHPKVNEWVIADRGKFKIFYLDKWTQVVPKDRAVVISIPKKTIHGLISLSETSYLVVRDGEADTIYVEK